MLSVLIVRIGAEHYAIDVLSIQEVVPIMEIHQLPGSMSFLEGFIDVRGHLYAIVDLSKRFGNQREQYFRANRILLAHCNQRNLGFIVDEILQVEQWNAADYQQGILSLEEPHMTGAIGTSEQGARVQVIHLQNVLSKDEILSLTARTVDV